MPPLYSILMSIIDNMFSIYIEHTIMIVIYHMLGNRIWVFLFTFNQNLNQTIILFENLLI